MLQGSGIEIGHMNGTQISAGGTTGEWSGWLFVPRFAFSFQLRLGFCERGSAGGASQGGRKLEGPRAGLLL